MDEYLYTNNAPSQAHEYLLPVVLRLVGKLSRDRRAFRVFELGCGNGFVAAQLTCADCEVIGVDTSRSGIELAKKAYPNLSLNVGSAYDDLPGIYGRFPLVVSLEVIEHCYYPKQFALTLFNLLEPGGTAIISTPYHGYLKNLALAVLGKWDEHHTTLWDHGHIKFFSMHTLAKLLEETGFSEISFLRVGRIPPLAKSMIAMARRRPE